MLIIQEPLLRQEKSCPLRMIDFFMVAGAEVPRYLPNEPKIPAKVLYRYPEKDYPDCELPPFSYMFFFPTGVCLTEEEQSPSCHYFVLTDLDGQRLYGCVLKYYERISIAIEAPSQNEDSGNQPNVEHVVRYMPRSISFFSRSCILNLLKEVAVHAYKIIKTESRLPSFPLESFIYSIVGRLPMYGMRHVIEIDVGNFKFNSKRQSYHPNNQICWWSVFRSLDFMNVIRVISALLTEQKIIISSSQIGLQTTAAETFLQLIYPFEWRHTYIPCLPTELIDYIHAPGTYFMGLTEDLMKDIPLDSLLDMGATVILLDENRVFSASPLPLIPNRYIDKLRDIVVPLTGTSVNHFDELLWRRSNHVAMNEMFPTEIYNTIRKVFFNVYQEMLQDYKNYLIYLETDPYPVIVFDQPKFLRKRSDDEFWAALLETQLLASFLDEQLRLADGEETLSKSFETLVLTGSEKSLVTSSVDPINYTSEIAYEYQHMTELDHSLLDGDELNIITGSIVAKERMHTDFMDDEKQATLDLLRDAISKLFNDRRLDIDRINDVRAAFSKQEAVEYFLDVMIRAANDDNATTLPSESLYYLTDLLNIILDIYDTDSKRATHQTLYKILYIALIYASDETTSSHPFVAFLKYHTCWSNVQFWVKLVTNAEEATSSVNHGIGQILSSWRRDRSGTVLVASSGDSEQLILCKNIQIVMVQLGLKKNVIGQVVSLLSVHYTTEKRGTLSLKFDDVVESMKDDRNLSEEEKRIQETRDRFGMTSDDIVVFECSGTLVEGKRSPTTIQLAIWEHCITFSSSKFGIKKREMINFKSVESIELIDSEHIEIGCGQRILSFNLPDASDVNVWLRRFWIPSKTGSQKKRDIVLSSSANAVLNGMVRSEDIQALIENSSFTTFAAGDIVLASDSRFLGLYYLASGQIKIEQPGCSSLDTLNEGELFGEFNFITGRTAPWNYISLGNATVYSIDPTTIYSLCVENPGLGGRIHAYLALKIVKSFRFAGHVVIQQPQASKQESTTNTKPSSEEKPSSPSEKQQSSHQDDNCTVYNCSLNKRVQVVGVLSVTNEAATFQAKVLGISMKETVMFKDVESIQTTTDSVVIECIDRSLNLSEFLDANSAGDDIMKRWRAAKTRATADVLKMNTMASKGTNKQSNKGDTPSLSSTSEHAQLSAKIPPLSSEDYTLFIQGASLTTYKKDAYIIREGDDDQVVYQVAKGHVRVETGGFRGVPISVVRVLHETDMFGEMTFITGGTRAASVRADDDTVQCYRLEAAFLESLLQSTQSGLPLRFYRSLAGYLCLRLMDRFAKGH
eukprot:TRINITY_DN6314_c0_g2_i5.p1 TRINITY_DN6314_c0_g2~~TRINITY_DN6314_c0_g2_i5.p1  ORF type:complete len:1308 (-),score=236.53 TRINITY_DN6314_c0_g2_i5:67-3990(-)